MFGADDRGTPVGQGSPPESVDQLPQHLQVAQVPVVSVLDTQSLGIQEVRPEGVHRVGASRDVHTVGDPVLGLVIADSTEMRRAQAFFQPFPGRLEEEPGARERRMPAPLAVGVLEVDDVVAAGPRRPSVQGFDEIQAAFSAGTGPYVHHQDVEPHLFKGGIQDGVGVDGLAVSCVIDSQRHGVVSGLRRSRLEQRQRGGDQACGQRCVA